MLSSLSLKSATQSPDFLTNSQNQSTVQVSELRDELEARNLSPKGLKSQLVARLAKAIKTEADEEEANGNVMDDPNAVLDDTVDNKETKESKENRPASPSQSTTSKKSEDKQKVNKLLFCNVSCRIVCSGRQFIYRYFLPLRNPR